MFPEAAPSAEFLEAACAEARADSEADPRNPEALLRWGCMLLELANYREGEEKIDLTQQAIDKMQAALIIDPELPRGHWSLGNAFISMGFLCPIKPIAMVRFREAARSFEQGLAQDYNHEESYRDALHMCDMAPDLYDEYQARFAAQAIARGPPRFSSQAGGSHARGENSGGTASAGGESIWWLVGGFLLLGVVSVGAMIVARKPGNDHSYSTFGASGTPYTMTTWEPGSLCRPGSKARGSSDELGGWTLA